MQDQKIELPKHCHLLKDLGVDYKGKLFEILIETGWKEYF